MKLHQTVTALASAGAVLLHTGSLPVSAVPDGTGTDVSVRMSYVYVDPAKQSRFPVYVMLGKNSGLCDVTFGIRFPTDVESGMTCEVVTPDRAADYPELDFSDAASWMTFSERPHFTMQQYGTHWFTWTASPYEDCTDTGTMLCLYFTVPDAAPEELYGMTYSLDFIRPGAYDISTWTYRHPTKVTGDYLTDGGGTVQYVSGGFAFMALPDYGDVDENGAVELVDVILLNKNLLGLTQLSESGKANADVDWNGTVDTADSLYILQSTVSLVILPVEKRT
mgnify:CR=1 FL=1